MRPRIAIVAALAGDGAKVHAYDPEGMEQARPLMPDVTFHDDAYSALEGADALAIVTEWDAFRALDLDRVQEPDEAAGHRRSAQRLSPRRHAQARLHLCERRTDVRGLTRRILA